MADLHIAASVSVQKVGKHAAGESGDTAEIVERAGGGFSVVVVDGQGSGRGAKALSLLLSTRAVSLLKDGMRDRTAIEGVHDFLVAHRNGLVSATIDIITLTPADRSISIIRQASVPITLDTGAGFETFTCDSGPVGRWKVQQPWCYERPAGHSFRLIVTTDGVPGSGSRGDAAGFDIANFANDRLGDSYDADHIASTVLEEAVRRDQNRPADDLTVVALTVGPGDTDSARRMMALRVPM